MNCREHSQTLIEMARGAQVQPIARQAATQHIRACSGCAEFLETQRELTSAMEHLAGKDLQPPLPKDLESALLAEFQLFHGLRRRRLFWRATAGGALAASLLAGWFMLRPVESAESPLPMTASKATVSSLDPAPVEARATPRIPARQRTARTRTPEPTPEPASTRDSSWFVAIPYTAPLRADEPTSIVRMELPVAALISVGLQIEAADPAGLAQADVMVSADGRARAVRLLSISDFNRSIYK
jgi:hypothetical protein